MNTIQRAMAATLILAATTAYPQRNATTATNSTTTKAQPLATNDTTQTDTFGKATTTSQGKATQLYGMAYVGVPLIVGGLIAKGEDTHFRNLRNNYMPEFNRHADDYLQFAPLAVMVAMKAAGVESRSSWTRMAASDAAAAMIMGGIVNTLKTTTHVVRPDGSNDHSFPSGHTATAFMLATMLNKEYGHISPWIGVGAYTVASTTGLMRMANNKHWLSDVLTGAGIGIMATETGYWLADLLFKDKGLARHDEGKPFDRWRKPSFVGLYMGMNVPLSHYDIDNETQFRTSSGSCAGAEGAWFFTPHVGIGGRFTVATTQIIVNGVKAETNTFKAVSLCGGAYFSHPLSERWLIGSKALIGSVRYPELTLSEKTVPENHGVCFGSGLSLTFRAKAHYGLRLFVDYNLLPSHSRESREYTNTITVGSAFMATL